MFFNIEVNGRQIQVRKGETILSALQRHGIEVPTLCHIPELSPTGACRICIVEVEGSPELVPSCSQEVSPWMKVRTHSPRVIRARKTLVELLLANHPDDCLFCPGSGSCKLQRLAVELNVTERRFPAKKEHRRPDQSAPALVYDSAKCIQCGRCVRTCDEIIGVRALDFSRRGISSRISTAFNKPLNQSSCIACGQCILSCPTAALREKDHVSEVQDILHQPGIYPVVQYSPAVSVSLAGEFGLKGGKDIQGILNQALHKIGFRKVFDISFAADILVMELVKELISRKKIQKPAPLVSSCCPAWVLHAELRQPDRLDWLAPFHSPQAIMSSLIRQALAGQESRDGGQIHITSVMPCTAKKAEARREETQQGGKALVDHVLTIRELARLIRINGIDMHQLEEEHTDDPFPTRSSAGKLFAVSGGVTEALIRTLHFSLTLKEIPSYKISKLRSGKERKELTLDLDGTVFRFAVVQTMNHAEALLGEVASGKKQFDFIEVMACPGGCLNGGGQLPGKKDDMYTQRAKVIYDSDERSSIRASHKNPGVADIYRRLLGEPGSEAGKAWLCTTFTKRNAL